MTPKEKSGGSDSPDAENTKRLTLEEIKTLAEEAQGDPVRTQALMKTVVNQTLDEFQEELAKKSPTPEE